MILPPLTLREAVRTPAHVCFYLHTALHGRSPSPAGTWPPPRCPPARPPPQAFLPCPALPMGHLPAINGLRRPHVPAGRLVPTEHLDVTTTPSRPRRCGPEADSPSGHSNNPRRGCRAHRPPTGARPRAGRSLQAHPPPRRRWAFKPRAGLASPGRLARRAEGPEPPRSVSPRRAPHPRRPRPAPHTHRRRSPSPPPPPLAPPAAVSPARPAQAQTRPAARLSFQIRPALPLAGRGGDACLWAVTPRLLPRPPARPSARDWSCQDANSNAVRGFVEPVRPPRLPGPSASPQGARRRLGWWGRRCAQRGLGCTGHSGSGERRPPRAVVCQGRLVGTRRASARTSGEENAGSAPGRYRRGPGRSTFRDSAGALEPFF